jgi:hypothetical protein
MLFGKKKEEGRGLKCNDVYMSPLKINVFPLQVSKWLANHLMDFI